MGLLPPQAPSKAKGETERERERERASGPRPLSKQASKRASGAAPAPSPKQSKESELSPPNHSAVIRAGPGWSRQSFLECRFSKPGALFFQQAVTSLKEVQRVTKSLQFAAEGLKSW